MEDENCVAVGPYGRVATLAHGLLVSWEPGGQISFWA